MRSAFRLLAASLFVLVLVGCGSSGVTGSTKTVPCGMGRPCLRPAGVAMGTEGALHVADDASNTIWRVTYTGN